MLRWFLVDCLGGKRVAQVRTRRQADWQINISIFSFCVFLSIIKFFTRAHKLIVNFSYLMFPNDIDFDHQVKVGLISWSGLSLTWEATCWWYIHSNSGWVSPHFSGPGSISASPTCVGPCGQPPGSYLKAKNKKRSKLLILEPLCPMCVERPFVPIPYSSSLSEKISTKPYF